MFFSSFLQVFLGFTHVKNKTIIPQRFFPSDLAQNLVEQWFMFLGLRMVPNIFRC